MNKLILLIKKKRLKIIGLLSGTSADGVDACLAEIMEIKGRMRIRQLAFKTYPFSEDVGNLIFKLSDPTYQNLDELLRLDVVLGKFFARKAVKLIKDFGYEKKEIDLIGSHGQTIRHLPRPFLCLGQKVKATCQIGDPSVIAGTTGITTVGDFRRADMASGGEGAPLSPLAHFMLFNSPGTPQVVLNLGGIANLTILPGTEIIDDVWGFDTGPANMIVDSLTKKYFGKKFDRDGRIAFSGKVNLRLLTFLKKDGYFKRKPPKSTGRERFGKGFLKKIAEYKKMHRLKSEDLVTTVSELSVQTIGESFFGLVKTKKQIQRLILAGGGVHNQYFTLRLKELFSPIEVVTSESFGYNPDSIEALTFALFAYLTIKGRTGNIKKVTGAKKEAVLGKICLG